MSLAMHLMYGPAAVMFVMMVAVILALRNFSHVLLYFMLAMGVSLVNPWCQRCTTQQRIVATGHPMGWTVRLSPIDSPLTPFFGLLKVG